MLGRLKALKLEYTAAHMNLIQASRKVAPTAKSAGFLQMVHKFLVVVQLLIGEIPERSLFKKPMFEKALRPYFHIVQGIYC